MVNLLEETGLKLAGKLVSNGYVLDTRPERLGRLQPVPDHERTDRQALRQRLDDNGYLFLKGFFNPQKIQKFREYYFALLAPSGLLQPGSDPAEGIIGETPADQEKVRQILFNDIIKGEEYKALCASPELVEFYEWLFGGEVFLHMRKIVRHVKPGGGIATGAHYDLVYLREGTDSVLTSWIPLGDCAIRDGALIYLENSHKHFRQLDGSATKKIQADWLTKDLPALADKLDTRWLITDYQAGDMVIHNAYMVHASIDNGNQAGRMRLSTDIRYQLASTPIDRRWQNHWHDKDGL